MKLYLMRHGHSPTPAEAGVDSDSERPLSPQGRAAVRKSAELLLKRGGKPELILHSPLKRADQTAHEAGELLKPPSGLKAFQPLANALPPDELLKELKPALAKASELLAVGHQPQLGDLASLLSGGVFELRPGGLIALEVRPGRKERAAVLWSCNP